MRLQAFSKDLLRIPLSLRGDQILNLGVAEMQTQMDQMDQMDQMNQMTDGWGDMRQTSAAPHGRRGDGGGENRRKLPLCDWSLSLSLSLSFSHGGKQGQGVGPFSLAPSRIGKWAECRYGNASRAPPIKRPLFPLKPHARNASRWK
jgi:hypothetical protein